VALDTGRALCYNCVSFLFIKKTKMKTKMFAEKRLVYLVKEGALDAPGRDITPSAESIRQPRPNLENIQSVPSQFPKEREALQPYVNDPITEEQRQQDDTIRERLDLGMDTDMKEPESPMLKSFKAIVDKYAKPRDLNKKNFPQFEKEIKEVLLKLAEGDPDLMKAYQKGMKVLEKVKGLVKPGMTEWNVFDLMKSDETDMKNDFIVLRASLPQESSKEVEDRLARISLFANSADLLLEGTIFALANPEK
jgi:hypothetical protein